MRNRLVHAYFDINLDILWKTIVDGLPIDSILVNPLSAAPAQKTMGVRGNVSRYQKNGGFIDKLIASLD